MEMVDACCVRSSITYRGVTMPLLADMGLKLERAEMHIIRWKCDVSMKDRRTSEKFIKLVGVEPITTVIGSGMLYSSTVRNTDVKFFACHRYFIKSGVNKIQLCTVYTNYPYLHLI